MKAADSKKYVEGEGFSDITSNGYIFSHNGWTYKQCAAFAGQIYCAVWDEYLRTIYVTNSEKAIKKYSCDEESFEDSVNNFTAFIRGLRPGTYLRVSTRWDYHSIILVGTSETGFTIFDANYDGENGVRCVDATYDQFIEDNKSSSSNALCVYSCFDPYYMLTD